MEMWAAEWQVVTITSLCTAAALTSSAQWHVRTSQKSGQIRTEAGVNDNIGTLGGRTYSALGAAARHPDV